jgi:hypothetical protein
MRNSLLATERFLTAAWGLVLRFGPERLLLSSMAQLFIKCPGDLAKPSMGIGPARRPQALVVALSFGRKPTGRARQADSGYCVSARHRLGVSRPCWCNPWHDFFKEVRSNSYWRGRLRCPPGTILPPNSCDTFMHGVE